MPVPRDMSLLKLAQGTRGVTYMASQPLLKDWPEQTDQAPVPWAVNALRSKPPQIARLSKMDDLSYRGDGPVSFTWWIDYLTRDMWDYLFGTKLGLSTTVIGYLYPVMSYYQVSTTATAYTWTASGGDIASTYAYLMLNGTVHLPIPQLVEVGGFRDIEIVFDNCTFAGA